MNKYLTITITFITTMTLSLPVFASDNNALRILTSFPPSFFEPFIEQFKHNHPDVECLVLNKNTNAAVEEILRGNNRRFDIFWSSSAETFYVLENRGHLSPLSHQPFALSSIGWTQRRDSTLPNPEYWSDLLRPLYAGKIAMARPSRSGTNHMFVERFLQVRGWEEGWAYLLELAGSLSTITSRSFGVIDGVINNRFALGITIDFLSEMHPEGRLQFRYGPPIMIMPAQIALLKGGNAPAVGKQFIDFVRSDEGQSLLLAPGIRRVPYSAKVRESSTEPRVNLISTALRLQSAAYNAPLASSRYWVVNTLFDTFITFQLQRRQAAWSTIRRMGDLGPSEQGLILRKAEQLLRQMPVSESQASQPLLNQELARITSFQKPAAEQKQALSSWTTLAEQQLDEVEKLLRRLETGGIPSR